MGRGEGHGDKLSLRGLGEIWVRADKIISASGSTEPAKPVVRTGNGDGGGGGAPRTGGGNKGGGSVDWNQFK